MLKRMNMSEVRKEISSTARPVLLMCEKERRIRTHGFSRISRSDDKHSSLLLFACAVCRTERVYGIEG